MQQSRTHRQSDSWRMKDSQQGQHDHRSKRRQQRYARTEAKEHAEYGADRRAKERAATTAMGWAIETFG